MSFPYTSTHNKKINLISKFANNANVKRLNSYFKSCCDIMRSVFGKCLCVFVVNLFHLLYISGILPANWGINKSHRSTFFWETRNNRPWFLFPDRPRLDNSFPGSHLQHHPSLERWSFGSSWNPPRNRGSLGIWKCYSYVRGSINSLYWGWKPPTLSRNPYNRI